MSDEVESEISPGEWRVLEVMGHSFVATPAYEGHPYFGHTRFVDIADDEDYPRKAADLKAISAVPELLDAVTELLKAVEQLMPGIGAIACSDYENINMAPIKGLAALRKAGRTR